MKKLINIILVILLFAPMFALMIREIINPHMEIGDRYEQR